MNDSPLLDRSNSLVVPPDPSVRLGIEDRQARCSLEYGFAFLRRRSFAHDSCRSRTRGASTLTRRAERRERHDVRQRRKL